jgi:hypothetical protein
MNELTRFKRWMLTWIARKLVVQGPLHRSNIVEMYRIIYNAAKDEFTEDNKPTLDAFLQECFDEVKKWD